MKKKLLDICKTLVQDKINKISVQIEEINESMRSETKSSAGDKHETSRARMQAENEKLSYMLADFEEQLKTLNRIDLHRAADTVSSENLVITDKRTFFLATALGKVEHDGKEVFVISKESPIAKKMIGLRGGQSFTFNEMLYQIKEIF